MPSNELLTAPIGIQITQGGAKDTTHRKCITPTSVYGLLCTHLTNCLPLVILVLVMLHLFLLAGKLLLFLFPHLFAFLLTRGGGGGGKARTTVAVVGLHLIQRDAGRCKAVVSTTALRTAGVFPTKRVVKR